MQVAFNIGLILEMFKNKPMLFILFKYCKYWLLLLEPKWKSFFGFFFWPLKKKKVGF